MDVELPTTGCNILIASDSFYNYSADSRTRKRYYIYDGQAHLQATDTSSYGYTYTGTCLSTGDLVYKPELTIYYQFISMVLCLTIGFLLYRVIIRRLLP